MAKKILDFNGNYIGGKFSLDGEISGEREIFSPADLDDTVLRPTYRVKDIEKAIQFAKDAFRLNKSTRLEERVEWVKKIKKNLELKMDVMIQVMSRELGLPYRESRQEILETIRSLDILQTQGIQNVSENLKTSDGAALKSELMPKGVVVVIGAFSESVILPVLHSAAALLSGNAVIFKPSEKTSASAQLLCELIHQSEIPVGLWSCVHGDREVGRRLVIHENVDAVCFIGSYESAVRVKQDTLQQNWKSLSLWLGAKNIACVCEDANLEEAAQHIMVGAYFSSGQRSDSTSRLLIHESRAEELIQRLHLQAKALTIGHPEDEAQMGPLSDDTALDRYIKFQGIALREGAEVLMRGKTLELKRKGYYANPSIALVKNNDLEATRKSVFLQTEIYGPNIAVQTYKDTDEAIALANTNQYGLVASVLTQSDAIFERFWRNLNYSRVHRNRSTTGFYFEQPMTGIKKSGNSAHFGKNILQEYTYSKVSIL